jgi:ABC-2 type transport system permease protein
MNRHVVLAIARKDLVDAIKNSYILIAIILPVGLSILFKLIFPAGDLTLSVSVYDPGDSQLVAQMENQSNVHIIKAVSPDQVRQMTDERETIGGLVIPADFDRGVAAGDQPDLQVYVNDRAGIGEQIAFQSLIQEKVWELVGQEVPARLIVTRLSNPTEENSPGLDPGSAFLVMLLVMALAIVGTFVVPMLLVEEKEKKTLLALQVSPAGASDVVAAKSLVGLFYALLMALIILTLNQGWQGQWPLTLLALVLGALLVVLIGLLMGSLFNTVNEINTWSSVVILALMVPSWTTMLQMPDKVETFLRLLPTYYLGQLVTASTTGQVVWSEFGLQISTETSATKIKMPAMYRARVRNLPEITSIRRFRSTAICLFTPVCKSSANHTAPTYPTSEVPPNPARHVAPAEVRIFSHRNQYSICDKSTPEKGFGTPGGISIVPV